MLQRTYQLLVWKGSLSAMQQLPESLEFEYVFDGESDLLVLQLSSQSGTHPELLVALFATAQISVKKIYIVVK